MTRLGCHQPPRRVTTHEQVCLTLWVLISNHNSIEKTQKASKKKKKFH